MSYKLNIDPKAIKLFYEPKDRLRMTIGDERSYVTVKPAWAAPISQPNKWLALLDGRNDEILTLPDPEELDSESLAAVQRELWLRYLTSTITAVKQLKEEYGVVYWTVETNRGEREFVTQGLSQNAIWYSDTHLLLLDVDGNRFEIPNINELDDKSLSLLKRIV